MSAVRQALELLLERIRDEWHMLTFESEVDL